MKRIFLICLIVISSGCTAKKPVPVHPNAVSNLDSYAYDVLLVEQDAIAAARADFLAGKLPQSMKDPLNAAIHQYNITQTAWQAYHKEHAGNETALQAAVTALISTVGELQKALGKSPAAVPHALLLIPSEVTV